MKDIRYLYPKSVDILYKIAKFAYYANTVIYLHNYVLI